MAMSNPETTNLTSFTCNNCGATTNLLATGKTIDCPFCGSQYVIEQPNDPNRPQPEALLPFVVPDQQARQVYRRWLGTGFLKPRDLNQLATNHEIRAVYLPIWECSARASSTWTAQSGYNRQREEQYQEQAESGEWETRTRTVTDTEWQPAQGQHDGQYPRELVSASKGLPQDWLGRLGDFEFGQMQSFNPQFLIGREAEEPALDRTQAFQIASQQIEGQERDACSRLVPGDTQRDLRVQTQVLDLAARLIYLPLWLASFQYNGQLYRCAINGQTGKIDGTAPTSKAKVALVILGVVAAIILICVLFTVISRTTGSAVRPTRLLPTPTRR